MRVSLIGHIRMTNDRQRKQVQKEHQVVISGRGYESAGLGSNPRPHSRRTSHPAVHSPYQANL